MAPNEHLNVGQLWVDSSTTIQYIWTGEEWVEVGAACGGGSSTEIPVGIVWPYVGNITSETPVPRGWLWCNGSDIPKQYTRLLKALGYDNPDPNTTYKTPDLRGRYLGGAGVDTGNADVKGLGHVRKVYSDSTRRPRTNNALLSVDDKDLSNHSHGTQNIGATINDTSNTGKHTHFIGSSGHPPSGNSNKSTVFKAMSNDGANNKKNIRTNNDDGVHNHSITVNGTTDGANLGNHSHGITLANSWDSYTRPYTYTVHWLIKHD
jgi:microcystin-dependent protein